jgi:hypothetical protein
MVFLSATPDSFELRESQIGDLRRRRGASKVEGMSRELQSLATGIVHLHL